MNQYHGADSITIGHTVVQIKDTNILPTSSIFLLIQMLPTRNEEGLNIFLL